MPLLRRNPGILQKKPLHRVKFLPWDDRLKRLLDTHPVRLVLQNGLLHLIVRRGGLPLDQRARIALIGQNPGHRHGAPPHLLPRPELRPVSAPATLLIRRRAQHPRPVQPVRDPLLAHARPLPRIDIPDHLRRILVHHDPVMVPFVLPVSEHGKRADKLPLPPLDVQMAPDLDGNIPAVSVIDQIFKRDHDLVRLRLPRQTVVSVIDGNKAHPQHREYLLDIPAGLNIVPPEPGQVLHHHAVHLPLPDILQHQPESRALKIHPAEPVVHTFRNNPDICFVFQEIFNELPLVGDAVALRPGSVRNIAIFFRKPHIDGGIIDMSFFHTQTSCILLRRMPQ